MAIIIQHRNDTAVNWTTVNPILAEGEIGIENDTRLQKVGNGVDTWNNLEYYTYGGASALLPTGGYVGTAQNLNSAISAKTEKGTYSGTAGQLKAMIDSLATTGTITPDLRNYMELLKDENNVKVVQGVPVGGQLRIINSLTGAVEIVFPTHLRGNAYSFEVSIRSSNGRVKRFTISGIDSTDDYSSYFMQNSMLVEIREQFHKESTSIMPVTFNNSSSKTYITIGNVTDYYSNGITVVISNVRTTGTTNPDWSNGWAISIITEFETLDSTKKLTVTPSFNATHLNATISPNLNGGVTQKKTSINALDVQNDSAVSKFNVNTTNSVTTFGTYINKLKGTSVASDTTITPTGEVFHVTGTTAIATINVPTGLITGSITIIPDGIFTTTTAGNIALATTAVVGKALIMTYDTTTNKWYPSY